MFYQLLEAFNNRQPIGEQLSVSFSVSGVDRTYLFQSGADLEKLVKNWLSAESGKQFGLPGAENQVTSLDNAFAQQVLYHLLKHGIFEFIEEPQNGNGTRPAKWYQAVRLDDLEPVTKEKFEELQSQGLIKKNNGKKIEVVVDKTSELATISCPDCHSSNVDPTGGKCGAALCRHCGWEAC